MPTKTQLEQAEGRYVSPRLLALQEMPIQGSFDLKHIQAIHQYMFQDFGKISQFHKNKYRPGEFRGNVPPEVVHIKNRYLRSLGRLIEVVYSNMDKQAIDKTAAYLKNALNFDELKQMDVQTFSKKMADVYVRLDYLHPFEEGNSRTLREFTREVGLAAGFDLHWERTKQNDKARDILYAARDLAVNKIALSVEKDESTREDITYFIHKLQALKLDSLEEIIAKNIEKLGMEKNFEMDAAEIKRKIDAQKKISLAMKNALLKNRDEFTVNDKLFVKHGDTFIETERALSPKEKLQKQVNEKKDMSKNFEM